MKAYRSPHCRQWNPSCRPEWDPPLRLSRPTYISATSPPHTTHAPPSGHPSRSSLAAGSVPESFLDGGRDLLTFGMEKLIFLGGSDRLLGGTEPDMSHHTCVRTGMVDVR